MQCCSPCTKASRCWSGAKCSELPKEVFRYPCGLRSTAWCDLCYCCKIYLQLSFDFVFIFHFSKFGTIFLFFRNFFPPQATLKKQSFPNYKFSSSLVFYRSISDIILVLYVFPDKVGMSTAATPNTSIFVQFLLVVLYHIQSLNIIILLWHCFFCITQVEHKQDFISCAGRLHTTAAG